MTLSGYMQKKFNTMAISKTVKDIAKSLKFSPRRILTFHFFITTAKCFGSTSKIVLLFNF